MEATKKNDLTGLLAIMFVMALSIGLSVLVLMHGWGLQPKSWWWIIGGGVFAQTFLRMLSDKIIK